MRMIWEDSLFTIVSVYMSHEPLLLLTLVSFLTVVCIVVVDEIWRTRIVEGGSVLPFFLSHNIGTVHLPVNPGSAF